MGIKEILTNPSLLKTGAGLLSYLTAGQQQGKLEDYFKQLQDMMNGNTNNPFTQRAPIHRVAQDCLQDINQSWIM